jgi:hypothetical protein
MLKLEAAKDLDCALFTVREESNFSRQSLVDQKPVQKLIKKNFSE